MQAQEETIPVVHKKNGIQREFTPTQNELMGKANRKMYRQADPAETKDLQTLNQDTELERLRRENADLLKQRDAALKGEVAAPTLEVAVKTAEEMEAEALRVENNHLRADITSATSSLQTEPVTLEETDNAPDAEPVANDPNPELTSLRAAYEQATGLKPGRLGVDKLNAAIAEAGKVEPK